MDKTSATTPPSPTQTRADLFLEAVDISVTELAALRGVSRQYATRDLDKFVSDKNGLTDLCRTLLVIDTDSSRLTADKLRKFASKELGFNLTVGSAVSAARSRTPSQLFTDNSELWIWSNSPLEAEEPWYWESLCTEFLDKNKGLLAYFVPSLEVADRLAARFENELFSRLHDNDGQTISDAAKFGTTVFVIVTNLAASMPYVVLANPGSANTTKEGTSASAWAMGKQSQDFFELPNQFGNQLIHKMRAAKIGIARSYENFFPLGQPLNRDSGIPFGNYPNVDHLIGIQLEYSLGFFDGEPTQGRLIDHTANDSESTQKKHPLKFFPILIKAYRKKAGESSKKPATRKENKVEFFKF